MKTTRLLVRTATMTLALLCLMSCATGPKYVPTTIPEGKAVVYLYQRSGAGPTLNLTLSGSASGATIRLNGRPVATMKNGRYYPCITDPGQVEVSARTYPGAESFSAKGDEMTSEILQVEAGREYYVECYYMKRFGPPELRLRQVDPDVAQREISKCKLL